MVVIVAYNLIGCIFRGLGDSKTPLITVVIALQDLLVSISFLIILAIVNSMGVVASAGVGVVEKVCAFIMLGFYNGIGKTRFVMVQVEAARAGEAGKGFAVVANQVNRRYR